MKSLENTMPTANATPMAASGLLRTCSRAMSPYSCCMPIIFSLPVPIVCSRRSTASWAFCARRCTVPWSMPSEEPPAEVDVDVDALVGNGDPVVVSLFMGCSVS
jgi:hypothetical protein